MFIFMMRPRFAPAEFTAVVVLALAARPGPRMSTPLFSGVVASLADSSTSIVKWLTAGSDARLTVDPRPLRTRPTGGVENAENDMRLAGRPTVDSLPPSEVAQRLRVLENSGFVRGDATAFRQCPGRMVGTPNHPLPPNPWKACPPSGTIVAAIGALSVSDTESRVEVVVLMAGPETSALINSFTMKLQREKWRLSKQDAWVLVE
jgi:hypothetical protein